MTQFLPPSLLALFAPRPPIAFLPPEESKKLPPYTGISQCLPQFEDPTQRPPLDEGHMPMRRKELNQYLSRKRVREHQSKNEEAVKAWDPHKDPKTTGDPYKTLFVCRLSYNTSDHKLKREFEMYGPVKKVRIIADQEGKPRGYAFVEFEKERDMKAAKQADGKKIDGKRIFVDTERGRTQRGWKPRRYGGGLGYTRASEEDRRIIREREAANRGSDDRERDRDKDREKDREKDKDRDHKDRDKEKRDRDGHREKDRERDRDRDRGDKDKDKDREKDKDRSKDKEKSRDRDRERRH